jgi:hypothetical protein
VPPKAVPSASLVLLNGYVDGVADAAELVLNGQRITEIGKPLVRPVRLEQV